MAIANTETYKGSNGLQNQQQIAQNQTQHFPRPRQRQTASQHSQTIEQTQQLFTQEVSNDALETAIAYIGDIIKSHEDIKASTLLIEILEKLRSIPGEVSAEDTVERETSIAEIELLFLELASYLTSNDTLDSSKFNKEVIEVIGRENTSSYPIILLLRDAIKRVRNSNNRSIEPRINTVQQVALIGIAKQIRNQ